MRHRLCATYVPLSGVICTVYPSTDDRHFKYSINHNKYSVCVMAWVHTPWVLSVWSMHAPWVFSIHGLRIHHGYSLYGLCMHRRFSLYTVYAYIMATLCMVHAYTMAVLCTRSMPHTPWVLFVHGLYIHHGYTVHGLCTHHGYPLYGLCLHIGTLCMVYAYINSSLCKVYGQHHRYPVHSAAITLHITTLCADYS